MCTQPIYENRIKLEFKKNLEKLEIAIEEANKVLLKKYKLKKNKK